MKKGVRIVRVVYQTNSFSLSCVEPDGASYQSYILAEKEQQREATLNADSRKDNSVVSEVDQDFVENDDSDVNVVDDNVSTIKPALPWDVEISEGNPADGTW